MLIDISSVSINCVVYISGLLIKDYVAFLAYVGQKSTRQHLIDDNLKTIY